jgi:hypothetical protein
MNQGTRRESENVAHRFFIRNAYLFQKGQQNILPAVLPAPNFRITSQLANPEDGLRAGRLQNPENSSVNRQCMPMEPGRPRPASNDNQTMYEATYKRTPTLEPRWN